jgi:SAM-dependent methyltransferase
MDAYTAFAQVYDLFMDNVPYDVWCEYICGVLQEHGIDDGSVLDLGCGTGELTRRMAAAGYAMIGADASIDMLQEAYAAQMVYEDEAFDDPETGEEQPGQKANGVHVESDPPEDAGILYLQQPMQELDLGGTVRAVYSSCDCVNYILDPSELLETFRRVHESLEPGGVFLFDMNTDYKYRTLLGNETFAESREEGAFIWDNFYDEEERINEYDVTLFIPEQDGLYRRYTETHFQRNYDPAQVEAFLAQAGFADVRIYDDYTKEPLRPDSERATFISIRK